jgi:hypothetical protein
MSMRLTRILTPAFFVFLLTGCAAMHVALSKKDLKVETLMSDTIFLDAETRAAKTIYLEVKNTTDRNINIQSLLEEKLQTRGYSLVSAPKRAGYVVQVNILQVGVADPSAYEKAVRDGPWGYSAAYGGMAAGAAVGAGVGALAGAGPGALTGLGVGGIVGGTADLVANSLVKDVTYSIITDVLIGEKTTGAVTESQNANLSRGRGTTVSQTVRKKSDRARYATRIGSSANKVNLRFEDALPRSEENLARSIAGIF